VISGELDAAVATPPESPQHAKASAATIRALRGRRINAIRSILLPRSLPSPTI